MWLHRLIEWSTAYGTEPVFITQPTMHYRWSEEGRVIGMDRIFRMGDYEYNGLDYYHLLNEMNRAIVRAAKSENWLVVDLTNRDIWEEGDFFDLVHNTPSGMRKVGVEIGRELIRRIQAPRDGDR